MDARAALGERWRAGAWHHPQDLRPPLDKAAGLMMVTADHAAREQPDASTQIHNQMKIRPFSPRTARRAVGVLLIVSGVLYMAYIVVLGFAVSQMNFGHRPPPTDAGITIFGGMLYSLPFALPLVTLGVLLSRPKELPKWLTYTLGAGFVVFAGSFVWPLKSHVTGNINVTILNGDETPMPGLKAEESWGIHGYTDKGGTEARTTDALGNIHFPPREARSSVGMRLVQDIFAYLAGSPSRDLGPGANINITLPPGYWFPAKSETAEVNYHHPYFTKPAHHPIADPPLLYYGIYNGDSSHPVIRIAGRASGIANDEDILLQVRPATSEETRILDNYNRRQPTSD